MNKHKRFTPEQKYQIVKEFIAGKGAITISHAKMERALWNQNHNQATQNQPNSLTFEPEICSV